MRPAVRGGQCHLPFLALLDLYQNNFLQGYQKIRNSEHRATRIIPASKELPYEERLKKLNLPSLIKINKDGQDMTTQSKTAPTYTRGQSHVINIPLRIFFHLKHYVTYW